MAHKVSLLNSERRPLTRVCSGIASWDVAKGISGSTGDELLYNHALYTVDV